MKHLMSCDIEGSSDFISGSSSWHGKTPPAKFDGHRQCGSEDIDIPANLVILLQTWDICDCVCLPTSGILIFCIASGMSHATHVLNNNLRNNELTLIVATCFSVLLKDVLFAIYTAKKSWKLPNLALLIKQQNLSLFSHLVLVVFVESLIVFSESATLLPFKGQ